MTGKSVYEKCLSHQYIAHYFCCTNMAKSTKTFHCSHCFVEHSQFKKKRGVHPLSPSKYVNSVRILGSSTNGCLSRNGTSKETAQLEDHVWITPDLVISMFLSCYLAKRKSLSVIQGAEQAPGKKKKKKVYCLYEDTH